MPILLLFPDQLFEEDVLPEKNATVYLVEEVLFFIQCKFHKQKLVFHRASMKQYAHYLQQKGYEVNYIEATENRSDVRMLIEELAEEGVKQINYFDTSDNWLETRIAGSCSSYHIKTVKHRTPKFLNTPEETKEWLDWQKGYSQEAFYIYQRKKHHVLIDEALNPVGGKWTFDAENRQRYPKNNIPPSLLFPATDVFYEEAVQYVMQCFPNNPGNINSNFIYPYTHQTAIEWLLHFLEYRFAEFGIYEDAVVATDNVLHHSLLSPLLNSGLLIPKQVLDIILKFALENDIPFNTAEGFVRQILGWREFVRIIYEREGSLQRHKNFWNHKRKITEAFNTGTTGILPFDRTVKKVLSTGYCHHAERLLLGNFMMLCEIDPGEVYYWFMEHFIDAYDWVMVPNIYGVSQFADGGLMGNLPYLTGSNYILKMSDYKQGDWCDTWDALYWRFINIHRDFFLGTPKLASLVHSFDKMSKEKQQHHLEKASRFLSDEVMR
ncbi:MAG: cryptochrome/photolyase family protein [Bacteroidota bacterium]